MDSSVLSAKSLKLAGSTTLQWSF